MQKYALIRNGIVVEIVEINDGEPPIENRYAPGLIENFVPITGNAAYSVETGWLYDGSGFSKRPAPPSPPPAIRYVPVAVVRERLEAKEKWNDLIAILSQDMAKLVKVLTLREGIDPENEDARYFLSLIGCDPNEILAPEEI